MFPVQYKCQEPSRTNSETRTAYQHKTQHAAAARIMVSPAAMSVANEMAMKISTSFSMSKSRTSKEPAARADRQDRIGERRDDADSWWDIRRKVGSKHGPRIQPAPSRSVTRHFIFFEYWDV